MCKKRYESGKQVEEFYALSGKEFEFGDKDAMFRLSAHIGLDVALKELVDEVDINQRAGYALRYACLYNHTKVVKTLLLKGADVHAAINILQRFLRGPYGASYKPKELGKNVQV